MVLRFVSELLLSVIYFLQMIVFNFFWATHNETRALQSILDVYTKASGHAINMQKSENLL